MEIFIKVTAVCGALSGLTVLLVGYIFIVASAFSRHILWGLSLVFFWPSVIVFLIMHWDHAVYGTKMCLKGIAIMIVFGLIFYVTVDLPAASTHSNI